MVHKSLMFVLL